METVERVTLVAAVVAVLISGQAIPAAADTGFTLNDFKVTHAVADIGATATVTVEGKVERDLGFGSLNVHPSFDLQQNCQNLVTPTDTLIATATINWPLAEYDSSVVVASGQHGNYLDWIVTVFYDPALDGRMNHNGICPYGVTPETTYVPLGWTIECDRGGECHMEPPTVTSMRLAIWPGCCGISPYPTKKGEMLFVNLAFPSGHTEY
jgi:hypothetical protein